MKKILLLSVFMQLSITAAIAQEPAICGDWIGVYKVDVLPDNIEVDYKRYIRIRLIDGHYTVRMKTRIADESEPFNYSPEGQIIEANDKIIKWKIDLGSEYDWEQTSKHKGISIGHADYYGYCTVMLSGGTLKFSSNMLTIYYDKQGREIDKQTGKEKESQTLYKEDSDW